jgi:hypothetical protein
MLNVAIRKKLLAANPCSGVEFPVAVKGTIRPHYVTWSEQQSLQGSGGDLGKRFLFPRDRNPTGHVSTRMIEHLEEGETDKSFAISEKLVDVRGLEPLTPCLQTRWGKTLTALSGVAYGQSAKFPQS